MAVPDFDADEDKPLDPTLERVQARLRRLMLIAGLTLGVGILAVFVAIMYRLFVAPDKAPARGDPPLVATATVPAGARLVSTAAANDRIVLTYEHAAGTTLIIVDPRSGAVTGRLELTPGAPATP
jgi:hypothetical protein